MPAKGLSRRDRAFVHEYDSNGWNGTKAFLAVHPKVVPATAATEAWKLLRRPEIRAAVEALLEARFKRLQMSGDEALARVSLDARADIRELLDERGQVLPPQHWPDSVAGSVRTYRTGDAGTVITLNDTLQARKIILEQTGKLKGPVAGAMGELARILTGDFKEGE